MKLLLKLAWRNIWRNKRRSILTLLAITFATFAAIGMRGVQKGTYAVNIKNAIEMFTGHIQIQHKEYLDNPSMNKTIKLDEQILNAVESVEEIRGFTPRVYADGLISFKDNSVGALIVGIDPVKEKTVSRISDRVKDGKFLSSAAGFKVVVGYKLLQNLKAKIGDEIIILSQGYDGSLGNLKLKIIGSTKVGQQEFDAMAVFIDLHTAQEMLALSDKIHAVVISLFDIDDIGNTTKILSSKILKKDIAVLTWDEVMKDFKETIEFDNVSGIFFLGILIVIVAFGILNTVLMSVTERFNEFGVILSIGMPQKKLVYLVFIETIFITLLGIILGNIIGWGINYYIYLNPIEFGNDIGRIYEEYGFLPLIESSLKLSIFINTSLSVLVISIVSCLYPAYKVLKLEPLKGIRYT